MIETGLPYNMDEMNNIKENGALVDMNNINFPNIDDNIRVSYIYLRNTDFNVELNFKKCSKEFKKQFVYFYLFGDILCNIKELNYTWMKIMFMFNNIDYNELDEMCILSKEEIIEFLEEYKNKINFVNNFLFSLSIFPIIRLKDKNLNSDNLEKINGKAFNENVYGIIKNEYFNDLLILDGIDKPYIFTDYFTEDNNILFELIAKYTPYQALLYGLYNSSNEEWNNFTNNINKSNEIIDKI